jgi:hypothetical protein
MRVAAAAIDNRKHMAISIRLNGQAWLIALFQVRGLTILMLGTQYDLIGRRDKQDSASREMRFKFNF